mgnify:CR=1 FL=1
MNSFALAALAVEAAALHNDEAVPPRAEAPSEAPSSTAPLVTAAALDAGDAADGERELFRRFPCEVPRFKRHSACGQARVRLPPLLVMWSLLCAAWS